MSLKKHTDIDKIAEELVYKTYKCPYCGRLVPNFSLLTKDMCVWCDYRYWQEKKKKETKA